MVRVLSCHHFRGQRIGKCEEAVGVALAGGIIIVGLEHQMNIYKRIESPMYLDDAWGCHNSEFFKNISNSSRISLKATANKSIDDEIGEKILFSNNPSKEKKFKEIKSSKLIGSQSSESESESFDSELILSHKFDTIDPLDSLEYNKKGNYILALEKRPGAQHNSIRVYFHWEEVKKVRQPVRARIAGLVSPAINEHDDDSLLMIEIPMTSPATTVASCEVSGNIACLSAESVVHIFLLRLKESSGRARVKYCDFDRVYAIELPSFAPKTIKFFWNYIACLGSSEFNLLHIVKKAKEDKTKPCVASGAAKSNEVHNASAIMQSSEMVTFDPKNESIKVYLASVIKGNRRKKTGHSGYREEWYDDIAHKRAKVIYTTLNQAFEVHNVLRVYSSTQPQHPTNSLDFCETQLYPIRTKETLGGISCILASSREAVLYYLPASKTASGVRVCSYNFTAPLISFRFDYLCFHALTETGLETYTCRSFWHALKEKETFDRFKNDCPMSDEPPSLVGIRPFIGVRHMSANDHFICLLSSPTILKQPKYVSPPISPDTNLPNIISTRATDESSWTLYALELPDIDNLYEDALKAANLMKDSNPEMYFSILCETHLWIRMFMNNHPELETYYAEKYNQICISIGLELIKKGILGNSESEAANLNETVGSSCGSSGVKLVISDLCCSSNVVSEETIDSGVTFLRMAGFDISILFSSEYSGYIHEKAYACGFVKLLSSILNDLRAESNVESVLSPSLVPSLVEYLRVHDPKLLIEYVSNVPLIREHNSSKLISVLKDLVEVSCYNGKETVALVLTLIDVKGSDKNLKTEVQEILSKSNQEALKSVLNISHLIERKNNQTYLTDLCVIFIGANSLIPVEVIFRTLRVGNIEISDVMQAFAQAVNLNSENSTKQNLTKALCSLIEKYLAEKLIVLLLADMDEKERQKIMPAVQLAGANISSSESDHPIPISELPGEDRTAAATLVRSYLSGISFATSKYIPTTPGPSHFINSLRSVVTAAEQPPSQSRIHDGYEIITRNQVFGKIPSFINFLISLDYPGESAQSINLGNCQLFQNDESKENFIKLTVISNLPNSFLASPVGNIEGVRELVVNFIQKSLSMAGSKPVSLILILQLLTDPTERAIKALINKQPSTLLLFAKETFGKTTSKWRTLVQELKRKISASGEADKELFSSIIESLYLHLANTLSPLELEEVLDKGSNNSRIHNICKRVEMANAYSDMVVSLSNEYLEDKRNT